MSSRSAICAVGILMAVSACNASGASTPPAAATNQAATTACLHALDLADLLLAEAGQATRIDSQIFDGSMTVTESAAQLATITAAQTALQPKYDAAKAACRASR